MRRHNYIVGYRGERQCIYGRGGGMSSQHAYIDPFTLTEAKKFLKTLSLPHRAKVYKLVEVKS